MLNKQKKYLGQHFLKNKIILEEMARSGEISKKDVVLEVGPGLGSLTEILAARAKKVIAIEKDHELIAGLQEKLRNYKNVEIIQGDILKRGLRLPKNYKIVANIPYYITSRFLRLFLSQTRFGSKPKLVVLMIQKEVADRILAKDKKESLLSLSVKAYAKPELVRYVSRGFFLPPQKVDSAIIKISDIRSWKWGVGEKKFWEILRAAFQQKRKMLRHSLKNKLSTSDVDRFGNKRPEELSLRDWVSMIK